MESHYTYFDSFSLHDPDVQKFVAGIVIGLLLLFLGSRSAQVVSRRRKRLGDQEGVVPEAKITLPGIFDYFVEAFVNFQDTVIGKENRKYLPLTGTIFLFTFISNIVGLIPGVPAITTTVWVTVPVALLIFISFNIMGIREHGLKNYIKHFAGPVWWLAWLVFPLEVIGATFRILTLNLRLYWNISADHMVLGIFSDLAPLLVPIVFYGLGTFVCFMQAFVPTVLAMVYILLATAHEEEEHH